MEDSSPSREDSVLGRRLGPYVLRRKIATGGMGTVYDAYHERLEREVALKTLATGQDPSPEDLARFLNEARAAARLSHPNLVSVFDVGEDAGVRYLAMELVRGRSLFDRIRSEGPLDPSEALELVAAACDGLQHAHDKGILHRDLKPANVLLQAPDGTPRITDFGVARAPGNQRLTATGIALGTPNYMSPEQAMGQNDTLDARSDVWGIGAVLYEALTGLPPFNCASQLETMQAVVAEPLVPPRTHRPEIPVDVEAIVLRCLAKPRDKRYPSAFELAEDIRRCLRGEPLANASEVAPASKTLVYLLVTTVFVAAVLGAFLSGIFVSERRAAEQSPSSPAALSGGGLDRYLAGLARRAEEAKRDEELSTLEREATRSAYLKARGDGPPIRPAHFSAAAAPLRASLAWRRSRLVKGEGAQGHAARAAVLDPHGAPGRKAWLGLARRLQASEPILSDENSRLALRIFESVGRTTPPDETTLQAREAAAHAALRTLDFARATAALQPLPRQDPDLQVLADLCADLAGLEDVPQRGLHVFGQSDLGPCLISATDKTIRLRVPTKIGQFHLRARASVIASCDLTGDGVDELLVAHNTRASACTVMMYGVRFEPKRGVNRNIGQLLGTCYDLCPGDLDGDGKSEVLVLTASAESMTILQLDPETLRPTRQLVFPTDEAPAGHWDHGLLLNLDGETGDEILLASSRPATPVVARGATKQGPTDALAELDLGAICQLETYQRGGIKPTQEGALAVVYDGPQAGIVLLGAGATSPLEFLARWPFPDELTSPDKTRVAVFKTQGGDRYVLRSYHAGSEWVLDATSLASLESGTPRRLLITRTARTARTSYRAAAFLTGNADGDPASELVLSDSLCGRPQVGSQSLLPQAVGAPEAYAALRAIREDAGAAALLDSLPASARPKAELGWLDLQAERRVLRENEARVGFASRHPGPSRDQLSEAEALGRAVVRGALALTKKPLSAPDRWRARRYGLEAAARAEDWAKVYTLSKATLGELRVAPNEIAAWKRRATRHSSLRVQDYKPWDPRRPFALSHPIRSPLRKDSTRLGIDSHSEEWIFAQLELSPSSLIEIQLEVELLGGVSYGTVQAGLVEGDSGHTKLTGVEIWLYNTSGPRVGFARFVVGSHPVSTWVELPGAKGRLRARLRAELGPGGGEVVAELHFADELILSSAGHADFRYSLPRRAKFGAIAKRTAKGFLEDPRFARRGWLGLLRFALGTTGTVKVASVREPFASFGTLARGNNREAISELSRALGSFRSSQPTRALILIARGMAKGRLGQKAAAYADFRASLKAAPLEFVWWLELCGEDLRGADAALLHGFLETMERSNSPTQADTARSLRGDLWSVPRSAAGKNRQVLNLLDYLGFRRADLPNGERFAGGTRYQSRMGSRLQLPWSKFPAIAAPTDVPLPAERFQELLAVEGSLLRRYAALSAAAQGRPDSPAPHLRLAEVFIEAKLLGDAEAALERALELTPLGERPAIEVEIAVVLERLGELAAAASRLRALRKVGHPVAGLAARFPTLSRDPIYLKLFK